MPEPENFEKALEQLASMSGQSLDPLRASDRLRSLAERENLGGPGVGPEGAARGIGALSGAVVDQMDQLLRDQKNKVLTGAAARDFRRTAEEDLVDAIKYFARRYLEQVGLEDLIDENEKRRQMGMAPLKGK